MAKKAKTVRNRKTAPKKGVKSKGSPLAGAQRKVARLARAHKAVTQEFNNLQLENDALREELADVREQLVNALDQIERLEARPTVDETDDDALAAGTSNDD